MQKTGQEKAAEPERVSGAGNGMERHAEGRKAGNTGEYKGECKEMKGSARKG